MAQVSAASSHCLNTEVTQSNAAVQYKRAQQDNHGPGCEQHQLDFCLAPDYPTP